MPPSESSDGGIFMEMAGNGGYRPADRVAEFPQDSGMGNNYGNLMGYVLQYHYIYMGGMVR